MSYGFMFYSVDLDKFTAACGSKDDKLRRMISGRFKGEFASYDEGRGEGALSLRDALRQVIMGEPLDPRAGSTYHYACKLICEHFGKFMPNAPLLPIALEFIDEVDDALREMGVFDAVSLSKLAYRGLPVDLPSPDDFPMAGYMTSDEVRAAREQLDAATYGGDHGDIAEAIDCIRDLLRAASGKGHAVVSFFH
jgi:hypothetical protein